MFEQPKVGSRWRHSKRGTTYTYEGSCIIEESMLPGAIYKAEADGTTWVRPIKDFLDGRFQPVE